MDYQFLCECDACVLNFPEVMAELEAIDKNLLVVAQKAYNELRDPRKKFAQKDAQQLALKYSQMMQKHYCEQKYPNREIVLLQLCIIKCFLVACKSTVSFP